VEMNREKVKTTALGGCALVVVPAAAWQGTGTGCQSAVSEHGVVSEKSIVLSWAVLNWSVQSDR
jgi:hypothetical protein